MVKENRIQNQMGNKNYIMIYIICVILFFHSCSDTKNTNQYNNEFIEDKKEASTFFPDTTICNAFILRGNTDIDKYKRMGYKLINGIRQSPVAIFMNKGGTEYLYAYQYESGIEGSYDFFEFNKDHVISSNIVQLNVENFKTESNLSLGMSIDSLISIKGAMYSIKNDTLIRYEINDFNNNEFLKRYNMPEYYLECKILNNMVSSILFGFTQP